MPRVAKQLPDLKVRSLSKLPGRHAVGGVNGLYLRVTDSLAASWVLRMVSNGRRIDLGLGSYLNIGLLQAREEARRIHAQALTADPLEARRADREARKAARAARLTFEQAAKACHAVKAVEFKNAKHAAQWLTTLETYAFPVLGRMAFTDIETSHLLQVLQPIWTAKTETATRLRQRIEAVLDYAAATLHLKQYDNPARWVKGRGLEVTLPRPTKLKSKNRKHHAALPWKLLPAFMRNLAKREGIAAQALYLAILTASRSGEVRLAKWSEFDLAAKLWTIPAERIKAGKRHRVPLSAAALKLLRKLEKGRQKGDELVFPAEEGQALSDMALLEVCRRMEVDAVPHGFRSSFKDWARTKPAYLDEVSELALAHVSTDVTRAAYARDELLEQRAALMRDWGRFLVSNS